MTNSVSQKFGRQRRALASAAGAFAIAAGVALVPGLSVAGETELQAFDGDISVHGTVMAYDGETYKIETILGVFWVDATVFNCVGADCPQDAPLGLKSAKSLEKLGLETSTE